MTTNTNEKTGIPYGIISCQSLDPDLLHTLLYAEGVDLSYADAIEEETKRQRAEYLEAVDVIGKYTTGLVDDLSDIDIFQPNLDNFDPMIEEPIIEGEYEGVKYRTTWLGGAQMLWVFESPYTKWYAPCSPCVPGAGDLDTPDAEGILCYDVPPSWRIDDPEA